MTIQSPSWMVGCGNMGSAIIDGWRLAGFDLGGLTIIRPSGAEVADVRTVANAAAAGTAPKVVLLAVKPQMLDEVAAQIRSHLSARTLLISLLAGTPLAALRERFPGVRTIVRAMPNLAVAVRSGVIALIGETEDKAVKLEVAELFQPLGYAPWMVDEERFAAVGSVAGAGPAYVARFVAALASAGERQGLSAEMATTIALETVFGTTWMAAGSGEAMDSIATRVASPGGTTEAGLEVLDRDSVFEELIALAIAAARRRGKDLAKDSQPAPLAERPALH
ncbi:MAG: pyrroline-5-carboxylate reductase dimerization domain-containing protein [Sphingomicrobium sp.]